MVKWWCDTMEWWYFDNHPTKQNNTISSHPFNVNSISTASAVSPKDRTRAPTDMKCSNGTTPSSVIRCAGRNKRTAKVQGSVQVHASARTVFPLQLTVRRRLTSPIKLQSRFQCPWRWNQARWLLVRMGMGMGIQLPPTATALLHLMDLSKLPPSERSHLHFERRPSRFGSMERRDCRRVSECCCHQMVTSWLEKSHLRQQLVLSTIIYIRTSTRQLLSLLRRFIQVSILLLISSC